MVVETVLKTVVGTLLETLPPEKVREAVDAGLDKVEELVENSSNKIDDAIVLPLIKKVIREPFGIEDNDVPAAEGA